ncbi:MAG TPA: ABC transporter permease, partial [Longimicrobium sp.]
MRIIWFLVRKEYLQIFRDRAMVVQIFLLPVIQLLVLSNAATFEITRTRMSVVDLDRSGASRDLVTGFAASGYFVPKQYTASSAEADEALVDRRVSMILTIPAGFERDLVRSGAAPVQLVLNAEEGAAAGVVRSYAMRILGA